jgi:hypothetical protein
MAFGPACLLGPNSGHGTGTGRILDQARFSALESILDPLPGRFGSLDTLHFCLPSISLKVHIFFADVFHYFTATRAIFFSRKIIG